MRSSLSLVAVIALALLSSSCGSSSMGPGNAPATHTVNNGGVAHAPGFNQPLTNCTSCHGATLRGGQSGEPSCYKCHGQKWP